MKRLLRVLGEFLIACGERLHEAGCEHDGIWVRQAQELEQRHVVMEAFDRGDHIEVTGCSGRVLRFTR